VFDRLAFISEYALSLSLSLSFNQIEPGSQTEQAPPSAVLWLSPEDMHGFRFLTVSVAPRPVLLAILASFPFP
jgi:hypothetical protein